MELIYLWIDGYKNLKNFDIILNSAYEGIINKEKNKTSKFKVVLKEKTDSLNIFGKNLNIMTLIGQNGSGKSNIINALSSILRNIKLCYSTKHNDENEYDDNEIPKDCKFCLVIKSNEKFSAYCSENCINDIEIELTTKEKNILNAVYHDVPNSPYIFRKRKLDQSEIKINAAKFQPFYRKDDATPVDFTRWNGIDDISKIKLNNYFYYDRFRLYDTVRNLIELYEFNKKHKLKIFKEEKRLLFNKYSPYLDIYEALGWAYERIKNKTPIDGTYPIISLLGEEIQIIRTKIKNNSYSNEKIDCLLEDILPTLFFTYTLGEIFNLIENCEIEKILEYKIKDTIGIKSNGETSGYIPQKLTRETRLKIYTKFNNVLFGQRPIPNGLFQIDAKLPNNNDSERLKNMLTAYIDYEENQTKKDFLRDNYELLKGKIIQLREPVNFEDINKPYITEIEALKGISKNLYMEDDKNFYDFMSLSTGEQRILRFFADIYYCAAELKEEFETNVFLFDEIDLSWHPEWQRKMVFYIKDIFDNIITQNSERRMNLIFTTHSPFILSDMTRNNVVLLVRNKKGNSIAVPNINDTFGANIYDLFNNNFFLGDCEGICTIGEFAKQKIQKIQAELSKKSKTNKLYSDPSKLFEQINLIGEPIIRTALLKAFNDRYKNPDINDLFVENCNLKRKIETLTRILYETDKD